MKKILQQLHRYCDHHSTTADDLLYQLERETHLKTLAPQMLSGQLQGRFLSFLSQLLSPSYILEIGTFTGYAAICLSEGLAKDGVLHTIEVNPELEYIIKKYLKKGSLEDKIISHIGDAHKVLPTIEIPYFDLIFIDAGKRDNAIFYEKALERLRLGGVLLIDNVLWDGKVLHPPKDKMTEEIIAFNDMVQADERVENILLPLRDGMFLVRKVSP